MAFGPNDRCYVLNHNIVCDVVPILCMCVDIGMENNVAGGSFPFCRTENPFSIFRATNDRCYVLNHGIVCDVVPILCIVFLNSKLILKIYKLIHF